MGTPTTISTLQTEGCPLPSPRDLYHQKLKLVLGASPDLGSRVAASKEL